MMTPRELLAPWLAGGEISLLAPWLLGGETASFGWPVAMNGQDMPSRLICYRMLWRV
jgi:hypothetical protein